MKPCIYRMYDDGGTLLYIGATCIGGHRFDSHRASSHFFDDVARIDIEHHETRRAMYDAERAAIRAEQPIHNRLSKTAVLA